MKVIETSPRLCLDIGNSRIKWAFIQNNKIASQGFASSLVEISPEFLLILKSAEKIYVANVADKKNIIEIKKIISKKQKVIFLTSPKNYKYFVNSYQQPQKLGVDRFLAMWGLINSQEIKAVLRANVNKKIINVVIVMCGTAVTIEVLQLTQNLKKIIKAQFIGGVIMPGLMTMASSLNLAAANLPKINSGSFKKINNPQAINTEQAIQIGVVNALCGGIEKTIVNITKKNKIAQVFITGGDAQVVAQNLDVIKNKIVPDLVIKGMLAID